MRAKLKAVNDQLKRRMHQPVPEQGRWLASVVRGHMAYYAVPSNHEAVAAFCDQVTRYWLKALRRRSQKTRIDWTRMVRIRKRWLPPVRVMHPFPEAHTRRHTPKVGAQCGNPARWGSPRGAARKGSPLPRLRA